MEFQRLVWATISTANQVPRIDRNVVREIGNILKEEPDHLEGKDKVEGDGEIRTTGKKNNCILGKMERTRSWSW